MMMIWYDDDDLSIDRAGWTLINDKMDGLWGKRKKATFKIK